MTTLLYKDDSRQKLLAGVDAVANAVKVTLGAKGRNVAISRGPGKTPQITKDGVTVANHVIRLEDPYADMGAQMVKDAARNAMIKAGDGTTTATLLAQAIFTEGLKEIESGHNPIDLKKGIDKAVALVVESIKYQSRQLEGNKQQLFQVASISANGDEEIAEVVAAAIDKVGGSGLITAIKSRNPKTEMEILEGMQFDKGFIHPYFVNTKKEMAELENPYILLYDGKISKMADIEPTLEMIVKNKASLLIIAEDVEGEALFTLTANVIKGNLKCIACRAPFGGVDALEDIAAITGATVVSEKKGHTLKTAKAEFLGKADSVRAQIDNTVIVGGKGKRSLIEARKANIELQLEETTENDKFRFQARLNRMSEKVAVIYVGGQSDPEVSEKADRVDDAIKAVRAAMVEGVVPGGGVVFLRAEEAVFNSEECGIGSIGAGMNIVYRALSEPMRQILINAGENATEIISGLLEGWGDYGYNVKSGKAEHFFDKGVVDPAKVSRVALESAASLAGILLTTECCIVEI